MTKVDDQLKSLDVRMAKVDDQLQFLADQVADLVKRDSVTGESIDALHNRVSVLEHRDDSRRHNLETPSVAPVAGRTGKSVTPQSITPEARRMEPLEECPNCKASVRSLEPEKNNCPRCGSPFGEREIRGTEGNG